MQIQFANETQVKIADMLWSAQTQKEVNVILRLFGAEARAVQMMMIAAAFDEITDVTDAEQVLQRFL